MSRYSGIIENDIVNGEGVSVSFWAQGCPFHCINCHNPETWDFSKGEPYTNKVKFEIIKLINKNDIQRNFSVLGGEPLAPQNLNMINDIVTGVKTAYPKIKIYLWTGYTLEELKERIENEPDLKNILKNVNVLITGRYIDELRDITLHLRGSLNQEIHYDAFRGE